MVDHEMNLWFFKEGYVRLSSSEFDLQKLEDDFVHLTNIAIQKHSPAYQEENNILSFA